MNQINGLAAILGEMPGGYARSSGPLTASRLPITYWYPAWWGLSPYSSPYWTATRIA